MEHTMWEIEDQNYEAGFKVICGVDEAGRGLWRDLFTLLR